MDSLEDMEQFCKFQISPLRLLQHLGAGIHNILQTNPNSTGTRQQTACFDNENKRLYLQGKLIMIKTLKYKETYSTTCMQK